MSQSQNIAAALLRYAPTAEVADTLSTLSGGRGQRGRQGVSEERARRMWKRGRSSVEDAVAAVGLTTSPELLGEIAERDRRQGVLAAVAANRHAELETLVGVATSSKTNWETTRTARQRAEAWVHRQSCGEALLARLVACEYTPALSALCSHPRLDPAAAQAVLVMCAGRAELGGLPRELAAHPRLASLGEEVLLTLVRIEDVAAKMSQHPDVAALPSSVIEELIERAPAVNLVRCNLGEVWEERMRAHWLTQDPVPWAPIAALASTPVELLGDAPLRNSRNQLFAGALGRYLAHRLGSSSVHWQLAVELAGEAAGSLRELVETVEAALGAVPE